MKAKCISDLVHFADEDNDIYSVATRRKSVGEVMQFSKPTNEFR